LGFRTNAARTISLASGRLYSSCSRIAIASSSSAERCAVSRGSASRGPWISANLPTLPCSFATISLARCSPMPRSDFNMLTLPSSMACAIAAIGMVSALSAAFGPTPETVMNRSKNSRSTSFVNPISTWNPRPGSICW
jgi:hypothetical protein